jgi:hypothetical protein
MEGGFDMRDLLDSWPFDAEDAIRVVTMPDGRQVMQIRLPLGMEQYELIGRPDGLRPYGRDSALEYHRERLEQFRNQPTDGEAFHLDQQTCQELFQEGLLYYYRYLHLFELQDWAATARDTGRNLVLFDFVQRHAERAEDRAYLEQWRPYVLRFDAVARAMSELVADRPAAAVSIVNATIGKIERLSEMDHPTFAYERERSLHALREMLEQIRRKMPLSAMEKLEQQLRRAVDAEEFEKAARLRDRIRMLQETDGESSCA